MERKLERRQRGLQALYKLERTSLGTRTCRHPVLERAVRTQNPSLLSEITQDQKKNRHSVDPVALQTAFHGLVLQNDVSCLKQILTVIDINCTDKDGNTGLHVAAKLGSQPTVKFLLDHGAELNVTNKGHQTPLTVALENNNLEVVDFLLDMGATVDIFNWNKASTALSIAARQGHIHLLNRFLKSSLDKNTINHALLSILPSRCLRGIKPLIRAGADINATGASRQNLLQKAIMQDCGNEAIVDILTYRPHLDHTDVINGTALYYAAYKQREDILVTLLKRNANPDIPDSQGKLPLHVVLERVSPTCTDCLGVLLKVTTNINSKCAGGLTPLHLACKFNCLNCTMCLLENGMDIEIDPVDDEGNTPLHYACQKGNQEAAGKLIESGCYIQWQNNKGNTPLHEACAAGQIQCVKTLFRHGALSHSRNKKNETPLHCAAQVGARECLRYLYKHGACLSWADNDNKTVLRIALQRIPCLIIELLDDSISSNGHDVNEDGLHVTLNYSLFRVDNAADSHVTSMRTDTTIMMEFVKTNNSICLKHPICRSFSHIKWNQYRSIFLFNLVIYTLFTLFLSTYQVIFYGYLGYVSIDPNNTIVCVSNESSDVTTKGLCFAYGVSSVTLWTLSVLIFVQEIIQLLFIKIQYFQTVENLLQWTLLILVLLTAPYHSADPVFQNYQVPIAAVSVILSWTHIMITVGHSPILGLHITMFQHMSIIFLKFILIYVWIIIGASLSLFILLRHDKRFRDSTERTSFQSPFHSFVKSIIMMTGEFDFEDTFNRFIPYPVVTYTLYLMFVIMVSLILANVLIALAVSDIQSVQKEADVKQLVSQMKLILHMEYIIPIPSLLFFPSNSDSCECVTFYPNNVDKKKKLFIHTPYAVNEMNLPRDIRKGALTVLRKVQQREFFKVPTCAATSQGAERKRAKSLMPMTRSLSRNFRSLNNLRNLNFNCDEDSETRLDGLEAKMSRMEWKLDRFEDSLLRIQKKLKCEMDFTS